MFPNEENPFPWMSEMIDLKKERNFFETRVIEYQTGGALSWEQQVVSKRIAGYIGDQTVGQFKKSAKTDSNPKTLAQGCLGYSLYFFQQI